MIQKSREVNHSLSLISLDHHTMISKLNHHFTKPEYGGIVQALNSSGTDVLTRVQHHLKAFLVNHFLAYIAERRVWGSYLEFGFACNLDFDMFGDENLRTLWAVSLKYTSRFTKFDKEDTCLALVYANIPKGVRPYSEAFPGICIVDYGNHPAALTEEDLSIVEHQSGLMGSLLSKYTQTLRMEHDKQIEG